MKAKPENSNLVWAALCIGTGYLSIYGADYAGAIWPFAAAMAAIRVYQIEAWHFEIEDDDEDDGDEWKKDADPVPTAPADDADWWKRGAP